MAGRQVCSQCWRLRPCEVHPEHSNQGGWRRRDSEAPQRIQGRKLQRLRTALFADEPFCRVCKEAVATVRDHIIPLSEGGTEAPENIQPLCQGCSDAKTRQEAERGQRRMQM